jgi:surface rod structure-forming protein G/rare lipoprotein A (RlpA)-like double-psi beta-barrel protein
MNTLNLTLAETSAAKNHLAPSLWVQEGAPANTWTEAEGELLAVAPGQSPDGLNILALVVKVGRHRPRPVLTNALTGSDLVAALGVKLGDSDIIKPAGDALLQSGMRFKVVRIRRTVDTVTESLPYGTLIQYSKDLEVGETKISTPGSAGTVLRTYRITYRNGREVSRMVLDEEVLVEPVDEVFLTGNLTQEHGSQIGQASWYDFCKIDGDYAAHLSLPFGTVVTVRNLDSDQTVTVVINDRGPYGVPGRIIDLCDSAFSQIAPLGQGVADVEITW